MNAGRAWRARYFDGHTAASREVSLELLSSGLRVVAEDGSSNWWPYHRVRQTHGFHAGEQVCLVFGKAETPASVVVDDPAFMTALRAAAPDFRSRFHDPRRRWARRCLLLMGAIAAAAATVVVVYFRVIPVLVDGLVSRVPVSWEERLGEAVAEQLAPMGTRCGDSEILDRVLATLTRSLASNPYTFRLIVADDVAVNAFAAPGGYVVVFRGLLERTASPEELAGVLAHEVQHVLLRHGTKALLRDASTQVLIAVLAGDFEEMGSVLKAAGTLGGLRYRRRDEEEADREGMRLIQRSRIDPGGMIEFLARLESESRDQIPAEFSYLSTHPLERDRIAALERLAAEVPYAPEALDVGVPWETARDVCSEP